MIPPPIFATRSTRESARSVSALYLCHRSRRSWLKVAAGSQREDLFDRGLPLRRVCPPKFTVSCDFAQSRLIVRLRFACACLSRNKLRNSAEYPRATRRRNKSQWRDARQVNRCRARGGRRDRRRFPNVVVVVIVSPPMHDVAARPDT